MAHSEVIKRCCKVLDNFDMSLILPVLFWAGNPPENFWVSFSKHIRLLVRVIPFAFLMKPLFCRRITNHGTVCLHLQLMPPSLVAIMIKSRRQLLDHCCRGKYIVSTVASKCLAFPISSILIFSYLVLIPSCSGYNTFLSTRRLSS